MRKALYMLCIVLIAIYFFCLYDASIYKPETEIKELQKTEAPLASKIEYEIPEVIANKPASEPNWGFDFDYICRVVAAESKGESYEGQVAVARCIWNTAIYKGITMEQVVEMPNRYADPDPIENVTDSLRNACRDAFLGMNLPTEEPIEYFYSGDWSNWHETALEYVMTIGGHKFFKEK